MYEIPSVTASEAGLALTPSSQPLKTFQQRKALEKYQLKRQRHRQEQLDAGIAEIDVQESDEEVEPEWEEEDADKAEVGVWGEGGGLEGWRAGGGLM
jgi:hypothetical protein